MELYVAGLVIVPAGHVHIRPRNDGRMKASGFLGLF